MVLTLYNYVIENRELCQGFDFNAPVLNFLSQKNYKFDKEDIIYQCTRKGFINTPVWIAIKIHNTDFAYQINIKKVKKSYEIHG